MNRTAVSSSNLKAVGYDHSTCTLEIEFKDGGLYQYFSVPETVYSCLMSASSHGSYFAAYIKKGGYRFKKVG